MTGIAIVVMIINIANYSCKYRHDGVYNSLRITTTHAEGAGWIVRGPEGLVLCEMSAIVCCAAGLHAEVWFDKTLFAQWQAGPRHNHNVHLCVYTSATQRPMPSRARVQAWAPKCKKALAHHHHHHHHHRRHHGWRGLATLHSETLAWPEKRARLRE